MFLFEISFKFCRKKQTSKAQNTLFDVLEWFCVVFAVVLLTHVVCLV